jgi:hypothetical protein
MVSDYFNEFIVKYVLVQHLFPSRYISQRFDKGNEYNTALDIVAEWWSEGETICSASLPLEGVAMDIFLFASKGWMINNRLGFF